jgi:peptidoglycan/xylan/chitin deacetylase (PgdA/CDA1 family)
VNTRYEWPDGARVAVSFTVDVDAEAGWLGVSESYAHRLTSLSDGRFGVVRGVPLLLELFARFAVRGTFFVPGLIAQRYPETVRAILDAGHEVGHHGHRHLRADRIAGPAQHAEIADGLAALAAAGAPRPVGYRSPSWELTPETFEALLAHDFGYDSSCMGDDRPYWEQWDGRRILELPVHWSLDDWPRFGYGLDRGGNAADPIELYRSWLAEYELARDDGRHVTYTTHPEVIGRGQRYVEFARLVADLAGRGEAWFAPLADVAAHVRPRLP